MSDGIRAVARLADGLDSARASDRRDGEQIARDADIDVTTQTGRVTASIGATPASGGRTVRFTTGQSGVDWSCTCSSDASPWCKHVVAAVLVAAGHEGNSL